MVSITAMGPVLIMRQTGFIQDVDRGFMTVFTEYHIGL